MKKIIFVLIVFGFVKLSYCQTSPYLAVPSSISQNYGSVQKHILYFHNAVDIPMQIGEEVKVVKTGKLISAIRVIDLITGIVSWDIYLHTVGTADEIIGYSHVKEDHALLVIYDPITNTYPNNLMTISEGSAVGRAFDHTHIGTSHNHVHITVRDQIPTTHNRQVASSKNPLVEIFSGFVDNTAPTIGPMFIKKYNTDEYLRYSDLEYIYGKVKISREIFDHMGGEFFDPNLPNYVPDDDIWPTSPAPTYSGRYNGYTSAPFRIEFGIEKWGQNVYPGSSRGYIQFDDHPLTNMSYIYDEDKDAYTTNSTHQRNYCYWLTNLKPNNAYENKYWNTALKVNENWTGDDAKVNINAQLARVSRRVQLLARFLTRSSNRLLIDDFPKLFPIKNPDQHSFLLN